MKTYLIESLNHKGMLILSSCGKQVSVKLEDSFALLMQIAAEGTLSFQGKPLVLDLFANTPFTYEVKKKEGKLILEGKLGASALQDCHFIAPCHPVWFIEKGRLKTVEKKVYYSDLKELPRMISPEELKELQEEDIKVAILFEGNAQQDPLPFLQLKDPSGAFASLYMEIDGGKKLFIPFEKQNSAAKHWENDLLESGYQRKMMEDSYYFCPLYKATKTIAFLLEMGWNILDHKGRHVVLQTAYNLDLEENHSFIHVRGSFQFNELRKEANDVLAALKRNEKFIPLSDTSTGLLHPTEQLLNIAEEIEIIQDKVLIKREKIGIVEEAIPFDKKRILHSLPLPPLSRFSGTLRPYQKTGVEWLQNLYESSFSGILADDMGLGKTVQVLAFLSLRDRQAKHLIVLPASLLFNWKQEIEKFTPDIPFSTHHGVNRGSLAENGIILTTYQTLQQDLTLFEMVDFDCICLDESQMIKNLETKVASAVCSLKSRFRLSITGTPIENHGREIFSQFHFLMPGMLGTLASFQNMLQLAGTDRRYGKKIHQMISPFILRRKKEDVAKDLPPLTEQVVWIEMEDQQKTAYQNFYASAKEGLIQKIRLEGSKKCKLEIFELILRLRQLSSHPLLFNQNIPSAKMEALFLDLEEIEKEGKKAIIFSQFSSMLHLIGNELKERKIPFEILTGSTTEREAPVRRFQQEPKIPFFLITLKAGGVGLNLTAADYVLIFDPWWHNAAEAQAVARAHRIGQTKPVIAKRYITLNTIEEKMMMLKEKKGSLFNTLVEGEPFVENNLKDEDYLELFEQD